MATNYKDNEQKDASKQKDSVIQFLEEYVTNNPTKYVGSYMLYADPNGSGIKPEQPETFRTLVNNISHLNSTNEYPYEETEKSIASVSIQTRVKHTLLQLMTLHEILGLMRTWILVHEAKGMVWPPKPIEITGVTQMKPRYPRVKMSLIRSLKSDLNEALIKDLPVLIDDVYRAKYKSSGTFSYALTETKFFSVKNEFLVACFNWIETHALNLSNKGMNDSIFDNNYTRPGGLAYFPTMMWSDWFDYSHNKQRDKHNYAPNYEKLCSALCARVGKLKYDSFGENNTEEQLFAADNLLNFLGFPSHLYKDSKKKVFQIKLYEFLMDKASNAHENSAGNDKAYIANYIDQQVISPIKSAASSIGIEWGLVYLDVYDISNKVFTKGDFLNIKNMFTQTGICSDRLINAITKFISDMSLQADGHSRKKLDPSIEMAIVRNADFSKMKISNSIDPIIIFTSNALESIRDNEVRGRFSGLVDKKNPGSTGYVQKGVMTITTSLKEVGVVPGRPLYNGQIINDDTLRLYVNILDQIATLNRAIITPYLLSKKKEASDREKSEKRHAAWGINTSSNTYNAGYTSPTPNNGFYAPTYGSPVPGPSVSEPVGAYVPSVYPASQQTGYVDQVRSPSRPTTPQNMPVDQVRPPSRSTSRPPSRPTTPQNMPVEQVRPPSRPTTPQSIFAGQNQGQSIFTGQGQSLFGQGPTSPSQVPVQSLFPTGNSSPNQGQGQGLFGQAPRSPGQVPGQGLFYTGNASPNQGQGQGLFGQAPRSPGQL
jgi:hypothetical protein